MTWEWFEWQDVDSFNIWHEQIKNDLGLPRLSIDQNGNHVEPMITNYTEPFEIDGKVIAMVELDHAVNLLATELRPVFVGKI